MKSFETSESLTIPKQSLYLQAALKLPLIQEKLNSATNFPLSIEESNAVFNKRHDEATTTNLAFELPSATNLFGIHFPFKLLNNAELNKSALYCCSFFGTVFAKAQLLDSTLFLIDMGSTLSTELQAKSAKFSFVDYSFAQLAKASFIKSHLEFVTFMGADLTQLDFTEAVIGKGVIMIGSHSDPNLQLPKGIILHPQDLRQEISRKLFSTDELRYLHLVFERSEMRLHADLSSTLKPAYLTASHLDAISEAKEIIEIELQRLQPVSKANHLK